MCIATLALVGGLAGAGISAVGSVESGIATANAANYQAQVAQNNAKIAQQNATYSEEAGVAQTQQQGLKEAATAGAVKTSMAANGVDVNTGSAVDVESSQREKGELDEETTMNNAELQAYGYTTQATGYAAQAGLDEEEAAQAPIGAALNATGGLLSGASGIGLKWTGGGSSLTSGFNQLPISTPAGGWGIG